jgi:hypothetical protein
MGVKAGMINYLLLLRFAVLPLCYVQESKNNGTDKAGRAY